MTSNLKKFSSYKDFEEWRSHDEWDYPSINLIEEFPEKTIIYNKEFRMRWYDADTAKVPYFSGDISHEEFVKWVDSASMPCEIKKDGTDFNYLLLSDFNKTATGPDGLVEKGPSHYDDSVRLDYLQLTELKQVNVGLFENQLEGWKEVRFNFDQGCPKGFHKWFAHPYWNEEIGCYTKLWGRYDVAPPNSGIATAKNLGLNCCIKESQGKQTTPSSLYRGSLSPNIILDGISYMSNELLKNNTIKVLPITYWEHLILGYIFCAYYKTFDSQKIFKGLQNNNLLDSSGSWLSGQTDILKTPHGKIIQGANEPYRFMYMENPLYGKQWIWASGTINNSGNYYINQNDLDSTLVDENLIVDKSNIKGIYLYNISRGNIDLVDLFGYPQKDRVDLTAGFYDGFWSNLGGNNQIFVGGPSSDGDYIGIFSRRIKGNLSYQYFDIRGRLTMIR